jgi:hypothetical protein
MGAISLNLANAANEENCVILNSVTYDSNDLITDGSFTPSDSITARRAQGVRRVNDEEVRVNTNYSSALYTLAENVRIYFVDGGDIEQIDVDEIVNDTKDMVYYVEDDGEITYLFIVDYDADSEVESEAVVLYGNREIEPIDSTYRNYRYHYVNDIEGTDVMVGQSLHGWLVAHGMATPADTVTSIDGNVTVGTQPYTVTKIKDGKATVTGTFSLAGTVANVNEVSKVYHGYTAAATDLQNGANPHLDGTNALFVAGSTAQFIVTATAATASSVSFRVDSTSYTATRVAGTSNQFLVSFTVPNTNFTVTVSAT